MKKLNQDLQAVNLLPTYEVIKVERWTVPTFEDYMRALNLSKYNSNYIVNNKMVERRMLKLLMKEYGNAITKKFIDLCFDNYRPSGYYTGLNFAFMYSHLRERFLGAATQQLEETHKEEKALEIDISDINNNWF